MMPVGPAGGMGYMPVGGSAAAVGMPMGMPMGGMPMGGGPGAMGYSTPEHFVGTMELNYLQSAVRVTEALPRDLQTNEIRHSAMAQQIDRPPGNGGVDAVPHGVTTEPRLLPPLLH